MTPLLFSLILSAHAGLQPGERVDPAVVVDITAEGLDQLDVLAAAFVPSELALPEIADGDTADEECIDLIFTEICVIPYAWGFEVSGFDAGISITQLDLIPGTDQIEIIGVIEIAVASASNPGLLAFFANVADFGDFELLNIDEQCKVWLEPSEIGFSTTLDLKVEPNGIDGPEVAVSIAPVDINIDITGLRIEDCAISFLDDFITTVSDFLGGTFGLDIGELLTGLVEPILDDFISDALGDLESVFADLLGSLTIEEQLEVLDIVLDVSIAPSELSVSPEGLRFALGGSISGSGNPSPCVSRYALHESLSTGGGIPAIGEGPLDPIHHLAAMIDDDLINQALFAVWYEGLLCFELGGGGGGLPIDLPIPFDTSLLRILAGDTFDEFFPTTKPIELATRPSLPPVAAAVPGGLGIQIEGLGLDLYAEIDNRMVRLAGIDIGADIPVGVAFDNTDGMLGVDLDLGSDAFTFDVSYNELKPESSEELGAGFSKLVGGLVGTLIGPLLGDLGFALPSFSGVGLADMAVDPAGPDGDFIGLFAGLGTVSYGDDGGAGGLDGLLDCGGGCSTGGSTAPWLLGLIALARRRRRQEAPREDA